MTPTKRILSAVVVVIICNSDGTSRLDRMKPVPPSCPQWRQLSCAHTQFLHCHLTSCWRCTRQTKIAVAVASQGGTHSGMQEQRDRRPHPIVDIMAESMLLRPQSPASVLHLCNSSLRAVNAHSRPTGPHPRTCIGKMPGGCPVDCLIVIAPSLPQPLRLHCCWAMVVKYTGRGHQQKSH